ncbi:MAG TPA: asparagine synthase-related protein [Longimicrobiales bacterium]|nr:asparagine synthase-related protein [Longimicrobiales bacterium]
MSDFLFSSRRQAPGRLGSVLAHSLAAVPGTGAELHGEWGSLATLLPAHEAHALLERDGHISVLVGNPLVRLSDLPPRLLHVPPRRSRLHDLAAEPTARIEHVLDGHFALLDVDCASGAGRVILDRFGFVPLFAARPAAGGLLLGTHVDAVARAAECDALDPVSVADFVTSLSCTFPWTVYRGVRQLTVAAEHRFGRAGWSAPARVYWEPRERGTRGTFAAAAAELREAVCEGVAAATAHDGRAALLLSGGEDSRAVLGAVPAGVTVRAVSYAESQNRELRGARRVARAYGADFDVGVRPPDHYARHFAEVAGMVGSHHGFFDVHGYAIAGRIGLDAEPVVLGGLSSDSLLKLTYWRAPGAFQSARPRAIREELLREVDARRNQFLHLLHALRPVSAGEWLSLWPFAMRKHGGNVDGNRRLFRSFEAFHVNAVLDIAATAPPEWKRHRRLFRAAFRPLLHVTRFMPHTKLRFPYYGRLGNALLLPGLALGRGLRVLVRRELHARQGSWPSWRSLADALHAQERAVLARSPVPGLIAEDPTRLAAALVDWSALRRLLLVQLGWLQLPEALQDGSTRNSPDATSRIATLPSSIV